MKAWFLVLGLFFSGLAPAAPNLLVNGSGQLIGANGVFIEGTSYDIRFADGTCFQVFGACDDSSFNFHTFGSANAAALAILETVLIDSPAGQFDTNPGLVFGCDAAANACNTLVPYVVNDPFVITRAVSNAKNATDTDLGAPFQLSFRPLSFDSTLPPGNNNFAVFSLSATAPVPEPETFAMMAVGLTLLAFHARHRRSPRRAWHGNLT